MLLILHILTQAALILRVILRPHRDPASRVAWIAVIGALPVVGILAYLLLGEVRVGRARIEHLKRVLARLPAAYSDAALSPEDPRPPLPARYHPLFELGRSISGFVPVGGNRAQLLAGSDEAIDAMVADIDAARDHVHLLFYIWLPDSNGRKVVEALKRAAERGVTCRALADDLGSHGMIHDACWTAMRQAGVHLARALPIGNPLLRPLKGRIDLRNHRKIVVIDGRITYCGSQNCADPAFEIKAKYAPWVDVMFRFEGPVARQNQYLFIGDWMAETSEDVSLLLQEPLSPALAGPSASPDDLPAEPLSDRGVFSGQEGIQGDIQEGVTAQVIGTGPTVRYSAMPELFESLLYSARREVVVTTPYYVPVESMQSALCASARRGVATTIVFPARNDSWVVGAASRSYYGELLAAGVRVHEYLGGLLHAKSLTLDGEVSLIGSANMDRRSFDLNYENNILFHDRQLTLRLRARQDSFLAQSREVTPAEVAAWTWRQRLWNNALAMLGPVL